MQSTDGDSIITDMSLKRYALLTTYSNLVPNSLESDFAKCAAEYIKIAGTHEQPFLTSIIDIATQYVKEVMFNDSGSIRLPSFSKSKKKSGSQTSSFCSNKSKIESINNDSPSSAIRDDDVEADTIIDTSDLNTLYVFCEGTSINIGTTAAKSGCGIYALYKDNDGKQQELRKRYILSNDEQASNQRAELSAFYAALPHIGKLRSENSHLVDCKIYISSKYAYNCVKDWGDAWAAKKWKRPDGPIRNVDIIRPLYEKVKALEHSEVVLYKMNKKKQNNDGVPDGMMTARQLAMEVVQLPEIATSPLQNPTSAAVAVAGAPSESTSSPESNNTLVSKSNGKKRKTNSDSDTNPVC